MSAAKKITVVQTASSNGKGPGMKETVLGLGLGKVGEKRELIDTPSVRGMVAKVKHLVKIEEKPAQSRLRGASEAGVPQSSRAQKEEG